jgi:hypothetical protein
MGESPHRSNDVAVGRIFTIISILHCYNIQPA